MIDLVSVISMGGAVLWERRSPDMLGSPVSALIRDVLRKDKVGLKQYTYNSYTLKWTMANDANVLVVVAYLSIAALNDVEDLLAGIRDTFLSNYSAHLKVMGGSTVPKLPAKEFRFTPAYERLEQEFIATSLRKKGQNKPRAFADTKKGKDLGKEATVVEEDEPEKSVTFEKVEKVARKFPRKFSKKVKGDAKTKSKESEKDKDKKKRSWGVLGGNKKDMTARSEALNMGKDEDEEVEVVEFKRMDSEYEITVEDDDDSKKSGSGVFKYFTKFVGGKELTDADLDSAMEAISQKLLSKNVAADVSSQICVSVRASLVGRKMGTFKSIKTTVRSVMQETLTRILTPTRKIEILREIAVAQSEKRPYVIAFVGVNGVGKSTSLSKICYYLAARGMKVSFAACDTFRAGAVEQLKTHAKRLGVKVFDQGYDCEPSSVAKSAVLAAAKNGDDVVLIDTAGRMQDNEPLMRALSKLINDNRPDLVLFVGEALVGNDGVDQLSSFNRALVELSANPSDPRSIDGVILTKFDTIDDKVGAAISMTYATGKPIVFIGMGQGYSDMRKLSVKTLIAQLLN